MRSALDARVALLERLIDHAPLFPPASLPLEEALEEDRRARDSRSAFLLARFVCPASRLGELPADGRAISAVLDAPLPATPRVEAVETAALDGPLPGVGEVYVEVPIDEWLEERLDRVASLGARAKVRCGGVTVPTVEELARALRACRARGVVFKATAGLHRAVRGNGAHGFLNLLAAVVFGEEEAALAETDAAAFALDEASFSWRDRRAGPEQLAEARRERFHSIGSCSFFEPVEELEALGILPL